MVLDRLEFEGARITAGAIDGRLFTHLTLLDTRAPETFASGHLRGAMNVGLDGRFAEYAGDVIRPGQQVVLLSEPGRGTEAKVRLARIGFDDVIGEVPDIEAALPVELTTAAQ